MCFHRWYFTIVKDHKQDMRKDASLTSVELDRERQVMSSICAAPNGQSSVSGTARP